MNEKIELILSEYKLNRLTKEKCLLELKEHIDKIIKQALKKQLTLTDVMRSDCEIEEIVEQNKDYVLGFYTGNELKEYLSNNYA